MTRFGEAKLVRGFSKSSRNLVAAEVVVAADVRRSRAPKRRSMGPSFSADGGVDVGCERRGADGRTGVGQRSFGQRNGGKGMGTWRLFVFIPLPPFLCQIRFGDWGSDSGWPRRVRRTAVSIFAKVRSVSTGASGSLSSVRNGGEGRGEEALRKVGPLAMVKHPSPRSCLTGRGRRTRFFLLRSRHELSQRLLLQDSEPPRSSTRTRGRAARAPGRERARLGRENLKAP